MLFFGCVLIILLLIGFSSQVNTVVHGSDPPILTFDAGNGIKAELSNYSLTNYSEVNGVYSGKFCFTLKNTSQLSAPQRPFFLTGVFIYGGFGGYRIINYSIDGSFVGGQFGNPIVTGLAANGSQALGFLYYDYQKNGIPQSGTASFCMSLEKNSPFTINDLTGGLSVTFSDGIPAFYTFFEINSNNNRYARVTISALSDNQMCFSVASFNVRPIAGELPPTITGAGFDLPGNRGSFELVSVNSENANQNFRFSTSPSRLRYFYNSTSRKLNFGLLTGQLFSK